MRPSANVTPIEHRVATVQREARGGHLGGVLWFTGLSGAGKSTLAFALEERLFRAGCQAYVLDGDNLRGGLNVDLGFAAADRTENIRRVGHVAALFADAAFICISAFISPYRADRESARRAAEGRFHEIFIRADLATCEERDPKGLYRRARAGAIKDFTAIDDIYEPPQHPDLMIDTVEQTVDESLQVLMEYVITNFRAEANREVGCREVQRD